VLRGDLLYLAATARGHEDVRFYALHRMKSAVECMTPAVVPPGFDLDRALDEGLGQFHDAPGRPPRIKLVLRCAEWLVRQLEEAPLAPDQRITAMAGGMAEVSATVPKSWQLTWWVLARTGSAEVIAPASYRQQIADLLDQGAEKYRPEKVKKAA
jgi:predicted DNA-binding transcriptional regulator YafY